jgi:short-subunit dehydrogenase
LDGTQPNSKPTARIMRKWLEADLSQQYKIKMIMETLHNERIDVLIYNVRVWEKEGFKDDYDFEHDDPEEGQKAVR